MIQNSTTNQQKILPAATLSLKLLGPPRIEMNGQPLHLPYAKAEALLFYLAATGQPHSREHLAALLWGNSAQKQARSSLRNALYTIRRSFTPATLLLIQRDSIGVDPARFTLDLRAFEATATEAGEIEALAGGLAIWRGSLLQGLNLPDCPAFETWLAEQRARYETLYIEALLRLNQLYQANGRLKEARASLERLLETDWLHEAAHRQLMQIYWQQGHRAGALRQYETLRLRLREELGVSPSHETQALHLRLLRADTDPGTLALAQPAHDSGANRLVGRQRELNQLDRLYRQIIPDGPARLVMIEGEAGIGKTRLAQEWLDTLTHPRILTTRCFETEQIIPFQPWVDLIQATLNDTAAPRLGLADVWLTELAHLIPEIRHQRPDLKPAPVVDPDLTRGRIVQAIFHWLEALSHQRPLCLFFDDWQWLDQASLTVLRFIFRPPHSSQLPLLILGTQRTAECPSGWPQLETTLTREGLYHHLLLPRLSAAEATALAQTMALPPQLQTEAFFRRLFTETEGNPLFIIELLRALAQEKLVADVDWPLPASIQSVIQSRLHRLTPSTQHVLAAAAVLGRAFTDSILRQVLADQPAEVILQAIEEGIAANLIAEQGQRYDFTHDKIRTVLADSLTGGRRRHLDRRVAEALEATLSNDFGRLSYHFERGGDLLRARSYALRAARQAAELYADDEALGWYEKSEALLDDTSTELAPEAMPKITPFRQSHVSRTRPLDVPGLIYRQRGLIKQRVGHYGEAETDFQAALSRGLSRGRPDEQAAAHNLLSFLAYLRSDYDGVGHHARQALELATPLNEPALRAPGLRHLGIAVYRTGDYPRARQLYEEALAAYRQSNDRLGLAGVYNNIGFVLRTQARYAEAIEAFQKALVIYQETGQTEGIALIHSNVGRTYAFSGDLDQAQQFLERGLKLSESARTDWITVKIHRTLGNVCAQSGQWPQALHHAQEARTLAKALGSDEDLGAILRLLGEIAAAGLVDGLGDPVTYFEEGISILQRVGAQDELGRAQAALADYKRRRF